MPITTAFFKEQPTTEQLNEFNFNGETFKASPSHIVNSNTLQLEIKGTFRFTTFLEIIPMEDKTFQITGAVYKSTRTHDYNYGELCDQLGHRTPELKDELKRLIEDLVQNNLVEIKSEKSDWETLNKTENADGSKTIRIPIPPTDPYVVLNYHLSKLLDTLPQYTNDTPSDALNINPNFVLRNILDQGLSHDELDQIKELYAKEYILDKTTQSIDVSNPVIVTIMLSLIKKLDVYKTTESQIKQEFIKVQKFAQSDDNCVIDLQTNIRYDASFGNHYDTITTIIAENYNDTFETLNQEEKDAFILNNFKLYGTYYPSTSSYYTPKQKDVTNAIYRDIREKHMSEKERETKTP